MVTAVTLPFFAWYDANYHKHWPGSWSLTTHLELIDVAGGMDLVIARASTNVPQALADRRPEDGHLLVLNLVFRFGNVMTDRSSLADKQNP